MLKSVTENTSKRNPQSDEQHEEYQYLNLINDIIEKGTMEFGRNGNAKTVFGAAMHFSLKNNKGSYECNINRTTWSRKRHTS